MNLQVINMVMYQGIVPLICLGGILGNLLLLMVISKNSDFDNSFYNFLSAIATLDLASIAFKVPAIISFSHFKDTHISSEGGMDFFVIFTGIENVFVASSCWTAFALAFDSWLQTFPKEKVVRLRVTSPWLLIFLIFMMSIVENLPRFWYYNLDPAGRFVVVKEHNKAVSHIYSWGDATFYLLLMSVLTACLIWRHKNNIRKGFPSQASINRICPDTEQQNNHPAEHQQPKQRCCIVQHHHRQQLVSPNAIDQPLQTDFEVNLGAACNSTKNPPYDVTHSTEMGTQHQDVHHRTKGSNISPTFQHANPNIIKRDLDKILCSSTSFGATRSLCYSSNCFHTAVKTVTALAILKIVTLGPSTVLHTVTIQHNADADVLFLSQTMPTLLMAVCYSSNIFILILLDTLLKQACKVRPNDRPDGRNTSTAGGFKTQASKSNNTVLPSGAFHTDQSDCPERPTSLTGLPSPRDTIEFFREQVTNETQPQQHYQTPPYHQSVETNYCLYN